MELAHPSGVNAPIWSPMVCQSADLVRHPALRGKVFRFANSISIGLRSGLQGGRNMRVALRASTRPDLA